MPRCFQCDNPLVAIGSSRANGANHKDWDSRRLHKKCFKEFQKEWFTNLRPFYDSYADTRKAYRSMLETFESMEEVDEWYDLLNSLD